MSMALDARATCSSLGILGTLYILSLLNTLDVLGKFGILSIMGTRSTLADEIAGKFSLIDSLFLKQLSLNAYDLEHSWFQVLVFSSMLLHFGQSKALSNRINCISASE